jgi:hypothetical protein
MMIEINDYAARMALVLMVGEQNADMIAKAYQAIEKAYEQGYQDGITVNPAMKTSDYDYGHDEGFEEGYSEGLAEGAEDGFNEGYLEAVRDAQEDPAKAADTVARIEEAVAYKAEQEGYEAAFNEPPRVHEYPEGAYVRFGTKDEQPYDELDY